MNTRYLVQSWQGLLQQLVYMVGRGYYFYHVVEYPMKKQAKWLSIDQKLIAKYEMGLSKFQRSRLKKKGYANFFFLRFEQIGFILHTLGEVKEGVQIDDHFYDIREKPMIINVGTVSFSIKFVNKKGQSERVLYVSLEKGFYRGIKDHLAEIAKAKNKRQLIKEFEKINNFPAWAGVVAQKRRLLNYLLAEAKKHDIFFSQQDMQQHFKIKDVRKPVKVWKG